jgi:quercetin dioxygenase-like cupin family protein
LRTDCFGRGPRAITPSLQDGVADANSQGQESKRLAQNRYARPNARLSLPAQRGAFNLPVPVPAADRAEEDTMISSRNADVAPIKVSAVEGSPTYGGELLVKPLIKGDEMTFLEIQYAAGVGAPLHSHTHESIAYVVSGKVKSTVGTDAFIMGPGDVCRHPKGVLHGLEAIEDSVVVEIKSPAPDIGAFFALKK